jgi:hypothetical protein
MCNFYHKLVEDRQYLLEVKVETTEFESVWHSGLSTSIQLDMTNFHIH